MTPRLLGAALVLGLLSAIGPFAIDMYLPALPSIQVNLHTSTGMAQVSLMAFFVAVAFAQLLYGPISDMVGRKPPIYFGLVLFALGSIGCAKATSIDTLIIFRIIQGFGACAGMVIPRAIVRDMHTGHDAARLMALLMLVFSVSPILAPMTGSLVIELSGWRTIFWVITGAALLGLLLSNRMLRETRSAAERVSSNLRSAVEGYRILLRDRRYLGLVMIGSFGIASFFAYLSNSSFVLIRHYGLSPTQYSLAFSVNAIAFIGAAQFTGTLGKRYGLPRVVRIAAIGYVSAMTLVAALNLCGLDRLELMLALLFIGYGFLGMIMPSTAVLALDTHGKIAGTASALMGTLQFATGALVMAVSSRFAGETARTMLCTIAACSIVTLLCVRMTLGRDSDPVATPVCEMQ